MGIVLVVEGDRIQQRIISKILQKTGLKVMFAGDGVEALLLCKNHHPELVVLDSLTPQMNSYEVCRHLKANDTHKPVVLMFSHQSEKHELLDGKLGADAYLSKLCRPQELVDAVVELLPQKARLVPLS